MQPEALVVSGDHIFLSHRARMSSGSKLLPRAMYRSMIQLQLGSVLVSVASVISGGLKNRSR